MVLGTGLEPARLAATASKTVVYAIPPPERLLIFDFRFSIFDWLGKRRIVPRGHLSSAVGRNFGSLRACVRDSKSAASASSFGSLHARPTNENPIGNP